jgi:hypothetical protein
MKEKFIEKKFLDKSAQLIATAIKICDDYRRQGYTLTLRQLYYQLVSKNIVPNTEQSYDRVGSLINDARLAGLVDWSMIEDRGRDTSFNNHWQNPAQFMDSVAPQYAIDTWRGQQNYVEIMVEKQALEGVLEPVCRRLDIGFSANKGYSSSSTMYETGKRLRRIFLGQGDYKDYKLYDAFNYSALGYGTGGNHELFDYENTEIEYEETEKAEELYSKSQDSDKYEDMMAYDKFCCDAAIKLMKPHPNGGRNVHIIYFGDHDPSGIDMTRDVDDRLRLFSGCNINVIRLALNMDQVRQYNPPTNPAKLTDGRAKGYIAKYGPSSWELDALTPEVLDNLVTRQVESLIDYEQMDKVKAEMAEGRRDLMQVAADFRSRTPTIEEEEEEDSA